MALTTLDPDAALLVVDLQKDILSNPAVQPVARVVARARALIDAFRTRRLPVVLINVAGGAPGRTEQPQRHSGPLPEGFPEVFPGGFPEGFPGGFIDSIPELSLQPSDIVVTKRSWGAFASTDPEARLRALGVTQVVILGVAAGTGVESTARQAYEAGFNVTLAVDAMTDARPEAHDYSIRNVFPRLGETGTSQQIIDLLAGRGA